MRLLPWEYAVRGLGRSPTRLALGVLGNALVAGLVIAAASFVRGMGASLEGSAEPGNVLLLGAGSEDSLERSEIPASAAGIAAASIPGVRSRLGVPFVSPEVNLAVPVRVGGAEAPEVFANFRGVTPAAFLVHGGVRIVEGRAPGPGELLVGRSAAARMGVAPEALAPGGRLLVDRTEWTVSGRFEAPGSVLEAEIWAPLQELRVATKKEKLSSVVVRVGEDGSRPRRLPSRPAAEATVFGAPAAEIR